MKLELPFKIGKATPELETLLTDYVQKAYGPANAQAIKPAIQAFFKRRNKLVTLPCSNEAQARAYISLTWETFKAGQAISSRIQTGQNPNYMNTYQVSWSDTLNKSNYMAKLCSLNDDLLCILFNGVSAYLVLRRASLDSGEPKQRVKLLKGAVKLAEHMLLLAEQSTSKIMADITNKYIIDLNGLLQGLLNIEFRNMLEEEKDDPDVAPSFNAATYQIHFAFANYLRSPALAKANAEMQPMLVALLEEAIRLNYQSRTLMIKPLIPKFKQNKQLLSNCLSYIQCGEAYLKQVSKYPLFKLVNKQSFSKAAQVFSDLKDQVTMRNQRIYNVKPTPVEDLAMPIEHVADMKGKQPEIAEIPELRSLQLLPSLEDVIKSSTIRSEIDSRYFAMESQVMELQNEVGLQRGKIEAMTAQFKESAGLPTFVEDIITEINKACGGVQLLREKLKRVKLVKANCNEQVRELAEMMSKEASQDLHYRERFKALWSMKPSSEVNQLFIQTFDRLNKKLTDAVKIDKMTIEYIEDNFPLLQLIQRKNLTILDFVSGKSVSELQRSDFGHCQKQLQAVSNKAAALLQLVKCAKDHAHQKLKTLKEEQAVQERVRAEVVYLQQELKMNRLGIDQVIERMRSSSVGDGGQQKIDQLFKLGSTFKLFNNGCKFYEGILKQIGDLESAVTKFLNKRKAEQELLLSKLSKDIGSVIEPSQPQRKNWLDKESIWNKFSKEEKPEFKRP